MSSAAFSCSKPRLRGFQAATSTVARLYLVFPRKHRGIGFRELKRLLESVVPMGDGNVQALESPQTPYVKPAGDAAAPECGAEIPAG